MKQQDKDHKPIESPQSQQEWEEVVTPAGQLTRRQFLTLSGGVVVAGLAPLRGARAAPADGSSAGFSVLADSHIDPFAPGHSRNLADVYGRIGGGQRQPSFVLHVGDVVESGLPGEYEEYERVEPQSLEELVYAVPGNHEVKWDEWALERYFDRFRQTPYSFDAGGLHVVALDPTQLAHEPGYFTDTQLRWLKDDLSGAPEGTPTVIFAHFPMGNNNYYINNQDEFFEAVEPFDVRAVFAGHIHREELWRQNGMTLLTLPGILNAPAYQRVERSGENGETLSVYAAQLDRRSGRWAERKVTDIALDGPRSAETLKPRDIRFRAGGASTASLTVRLSPKSKARSVSYQFYPEYAFGTKSAGSFAELQPRSANSPVWRGEIDTSQLAPGVYRLQVRVLGDDGVWWDSFERVRVPYASSPSQPEVVGEQDVGELLQAELISVSPDGGPRSLIIGATAERGRVIAFEAEEEAREVWSFEAGQPIVRSVEANGNGSSLFFGSVDHNVYALDSESGERLWAYEAYRPAVASPTWTPFEGRDEGVLVAPAGRRLHALDASAGELLWRSEVGGYIGGKTAVDENAVYVGAGDGTASAFDLRSGEKVWEVVIAQRSRPYVTLIYSLWATRATLLPGTPGDSGLVVISTVSGTSALERATGETVWSVGGDLLYGPLYDEGSERVFLATGLGEVIAAEQATGEVIWRTQLPQRVINARPVIWRGALAVTGVNGQLHLLDPATGRVTERLHFATDYVFSTPVAAAGLLFAGGQEGVLRVIG